MISRASIRMCVVGGVGCGRRGLSTGQVTHSRTSVHRLLVQDGNQRKKSRGNFGLPREGEAAAAAAVDKGSTKTKVPKHSSRLRNLNKVYLDKITDILSTGELASHLYGRGLELSEVSVHPNLQGINVYWVTSGSPEQDQHTEEFLRRHAKAVRHELSSLRIIGHSPPITFLRDDRHHKLQEIERLLAMADFGEDFEPTNPAHYLKAGLPTLAMPLDTKIKTAIEGLEGEDGQKEKENQPDLFKAALSIATQPLQGEGVTAVTFVLPPDLPTMRGDVLGVNTTKIYSMIQQSMKRARAEHRRQFEADSQSNFLDPQQSMSSVSSSGKQEIQKWARQYKQMQKKETRKKNREAALLSYPGDFSSQDLQEQMELEWEEVEECIEEFE